MSWSYSSGANWSIVAQQYAWCTSTFPKDKWMYGDLEGAFFFKEEKHLIWFKLRWA